MEESADILKSSKYILWQYTHPGQTQGRLRFKSTGFVLFCFMVYQL